MKRPFFLYLLFLLHLFLGLGAIYGGGMLALEPDGSLLGMDTEWLGDVPFNTYLIPGFFLFTLIGFLPLLTFVGLLLKPEWEWADTFNIYANKHWAWTYSLYSGIIVIIWITIQQVLTQYFWLQPVMTFTGLLIVIFTLTPQVIKNFEIYEH
ncbi:hypothetical protein [Aquiflexum sp.]|uniref:hypothetical protein n=1 Tax=Aquiflexum sp. TaxID=1872584 RepID=UPI0035943FFF